MKVAVKVVAKDVARAWDILVRHSPGMALADRTFVISDGAARALRKAGIKFREIAREGDLLTSGSSNGKKV